MKINFKAKYIINFDIKCLTGLHIGGPDTGAGIGDLDNPVIKDPMNQWPIIAGSSLKGRVRERLEWLHVDGLDNQNAISRQLVPGEKGEIKFENVKQCNCGKCQICRYFGHSAKPENKEALIKIAQERDVPIFEIGTTGGENITIYHHQEKIIDLSVQESYRIWKQAIPEIFKTQ